MADFNVVIIKENELGITDFIPLRKRNISNKGDSKKDEKQYSTTNNIRN